MTNKPTYLIFDLDYTLFDTDQLKRLVGHITTVDARIFNQTQINRLKTKKITENLLFHGVIDQLLRLKSKGYHLLIQTEGDQKGQQWKIDHTGLGAVIPKQSQYIYWNKKISYLNEIIDNIPKDAKVYYFDDKPTKLRAIKRHHPKILTVLVCQGPWWHLKLTDFTPDYTIKTIQEIERFL